MAITIEQYEKLSTWIHEQLKIEKPIAHWIVDDPDNAYCQNHIPDGKEVEFIGYPETEEDGHIFCEVCGTMLAHSLTDHGAKTELEYYEENGYNGTENERYTLVNISGGFPPSYQSRLCNILEIEEE